MSLRVSAGFCAVALLLTGCGGGGGGGNNAFSISFSTSSISMAALEGGPLQAGNASVIQANGSGPEPDALYIGATTTGQGVQLPIQVVINEATNSATITVLPNVALPAGSYTGTITLLACKDANCNAHHRGSPHNVSYSLTIDPRLAAVPAVATLNGVEGVAGTSVPLQIRGPSQGTVTSTINYMQGQGWLTAVVQGSTLTLTPNASSLAAGTYHADVQLRTVSPAQFVSVLVTFTVAPALQTPAAFSVVLNGQTQPSALQGSFTVGSATGATVSSWSATSDADWLVIDNATGAPNGTLPWHLDPVELGELTNPGNHTARITIAGGAGVTPVVTTITANKQLPEIANVERLGLLANEAGPVAVYGVGFSSLLNPATALEVTGAVPTAVSVLSDRMMSVTFPALPADSHNLRLTNAVGIPTRGKSISVLDPVTRNYETIATQGAKRTLLWDATTQSAFVINTTLETVMRFDLSGSSIALTTRSVAGIQNLGMPLDRSVLYAVTSDGTLHDLNTVSLNTIRTRSVGLTQYDAFPEIPLAITGDNVLWARNGSQWSSLVTYDLLQSAPKSVLDPNTSYTFYGGPWGAVSPNGQRMAMVQASGISPGAPMLYWDAVDGLLKSYGSNVSAHFYDASTDRQGESWAFGSEPVRGFDLGVKGLIELPTNWYGSRRAISRDGTRLYAYTLHENAIGTYSEPTPIVYWPRVYVFDISTPPTQTTGYPLIGQIDLTDYPACRATQGPVACSPYGVTFTITDDDRTLIAVGDRNLVVIPIPANLRSH